MLRKAGARDHPDDCLAQRLLMTGEDGVRRVSTARGYSQPNVLTGQGVERDLLRTTSLPLDATFRYPPPVDNQGPVRMVPVMLARGSRKRSRWQSQQAVATTKAIPAAASMITEEQSGITDRG